MITIEGFEMPDNCYTCPFLDYEQGYCFATAKKEKDGFYSEGRHAGDVYKAKEKRADWCPLKERETK